MVAKQETELDESLKENEGENLISYGPGFVNKLKSRYLSLTLRQATISKQRPSLQQLRRSTSLNNLLDDEEENHVEEVKNEENRDEIEVEVTPSNGDGHQTMMRVSRSIEKSLNLKRARSVEAILRYDNTAWERDVKEVTIEDKIQSAKERPASHPPKRLISLIEDDERPPPGICKQTMRIFEASANKKRNLVTRPISTEIANKVAMFKGNGVNGNGVNGTGNGHKTSKTVVSPPPDKFTSKAVVAPPSRITPERFVSPPPSGIKTSPPSPVIQDKISSPTPKVKAAPPPDVIPEARSPVIERFTSPPPSEKFTIPQLKPVPSENQNSSEKFSSPPPAQKPLISPRKPITLNNNTTIKAQEKAILPKLDIKIIKNNLETKSNGSWSPPVTAIDAYRNYSSPDTSLASSPNILSPFRNSISPQQPQNETSPVITSLSSKLNNLHMETSTPKSWNIKNNLLNDATTVSDKESAIRSEEDVKKVSFSPKINNNVTKVMEEVKKPTTAPPPYTVAVKQQAEEKEAEKPKWSGKKKSWGKGGDESVANTIVFNFSDRKDVPDYIDNDGLVMRRKRELPKPHESGFVLLGDLTLETSTDPDDAYQMGPPSPCDVEFENANIVPEGKSSIRHRKKEMKFKLQFDDSLTETFEYPSETSLMVDESFGEEDEVDANFYGRSSNSTSKLMNSVPLGSTPFANYQPQKASASTFELGITRTTPSPSASSDENTFISNPESDSEDYLKPATDEESQRWSSEGTRGTDLLF